MAYFYPIRKLYIYLFNYAFRLDAIKVIFLKIGAMNIFD